MHQIIEGVYTFNKTADMLMNETPTIPPVKYQEFFYNFILEELNEYREAAANNDIVGVGDAHTDILYVLLGSYRAHGLSTQMQSMFDEVQRSNMSKFCVNLQEALDTIEHIKKLHGWECSYFPTGDYLVVKRNSDGKVMKSINYSKPNLEQFFN